MKLLSGHSEAGDDMMEDFWGWYCYLETPLERLSDDTLIIVEIDAGMKDGNDRNDSNDSNRRSDDDCWGIYALDKCSIVSGLTFISLHSYPIMFGTIGTSCNVDNNNTNTTTSSSGSPQKAKYSNGKVLHFDIVLTKKNPEVTVQQLMKDC